MRKGLNALETVFLMFVLIIVVLVVVQMFTRFSSATRERLGSELTQFEKTAGYEKAVDTCRDLCTQYKANRRNFNALIKFCTERVEIDINGNDLIDEAEPLATDVGKRNVLLPQAGYVVCEKNIYCPQVYSCEDLNIRTCVAKLCKYYKDTYYSQGLAGSQAEAADMATPLIKGMFEKGECDIDGIVSSPEAAREGIPPVNWYSNIIEDLDCATLIGYREQIKSCSEIDISGKECSQIESASECQDGVVCKAEMFGEQFLQCCR